MTYDPLGRLWQVVKGSANTRFLYDGDELAAEYDGGGNMVRRFMFAGTDEPIFEDTGSALNCSGTKFLHTDHLGSVIALADCWGNRTNVNAYDEYGVPGASNVGRFQYTGQAWLSELGLYHYKARLYSPTLGRFLQVDPVGYEDDINLYAYVANDPINEADPSGLGTCTGSNADNSGGEGVCGGSSGSSTASPTGNTATVAPSNRGDQSTGNQSGQQAGQGGGENSNLLMPSGNGTPRECETGPMCQSSKDDLSFLSPNGMTEYQLMERRDARSMGAEIGATPYGLGMGALRGARAAVDAARPLIPKIGRALFGKASPLNNNGYIRFGEGFKQNIGRQRPYSIFGYRFKFHKHIWEVPWPW